MCCFPLQCWCSDNGEDCDNVPFLETKLAWNYWIPFLYAFIILDIVFIGVLFGILFIFFIPLILVVTSHILFFLPDRSRIEDYLAFINRSEPEETFYRREREFRQLMVIKRIYCLTVNSFLLILSIVGIFVLIFYFPWHVFMLIKEIYIFQKVGTLGEGFSDNV